MTVINFTQNLSIQSDLLPMNQGLGLVAVQALLSVLILTIGSSSNYKEIISEMKDR
jgi:hypothetical protein